MALGLPLGADMPFFFFGDNAFAEGVGEALQVLETPACWYRRDRTGRLGADRGNIWRTGIDKGYETRQNIGLFQ